MKVLKCPRCKSENIIFSAGGMTGAYECRDCRYVGPIVLEVEKELKKTTKKKKAKTIKPKA